MADFSCDNLTVAAASGVLRFAGNGASASGGYGIYRTSGNQLQFQGGGAGYVFKNNANSASLVTITDGGNVGIGTVSPGARLDVQYNTATPTAHGMRVINANATVGVTSGLNLLTTDGSNLMGARIYVTLDSPRNWGDERLTFATQATGVDNYVDAMTLKNGNVGIGITSPAARVDVQYNTATPAAHGMKVANLNATLGATADLNLLTSDGGNLLGARVYVTRDGGATSQVRLTLATQAGLPDQFVDALSLKNSNVGIGTVSPANKLDIAYNTGTPTDHGVRLLNTNTASNATSGLNLLTTDGANYRGARIYVTADAGGFTDERLTFAIQAGGPSTYTDTLTLKNDRVGIGTTNPTERLQVVGNIHASGVLIAGSNIQVGGNVQASGFVSGTGLSATNGNITAMNGSIFAGQGMNAQYFFASQGTTSRTIADVNGCYYS